MTRTLTVEIPEHPPKELSPNAGKFVNPMKVHRIKGEWQEQVAWAIKAALKGRERVIYNPAHVTFERVIDGKRTKKMDDDNLSGYFKATRDVLKPGSVTNPYGMGIIINDDPGHLTAEYRDVFDRKRAPMTIITVKEG